MLQRHALRARASSLLVLAFSAAVAGAPLRAAPIPATGSGIHEIGSTNFEVISAPPAPMIDYLKGKSTGRESWYVGDLLAHPDDALTVRVTVPGNAQAYGRAAGTTQPLAMYVLYPTPKGNPRPAYAFPYPDTADNVFPHMQRPGERPLFPHPGTRYPLIVYTHGYEGHGLWDLDHLKFLASHGYIVAAIFHGDGRAGFEANIALRPLQLQAAIDHLLAHPDFREAIDPDRIGGSGSSFGGYTLLSALGATNRLAPDAHRDARIKAGFGLVPFMGGTVGFWPFRINAWFFGQDYAGLRTVGVPFLAVYGGKDKNVTPESVEAGVRQMTTAVSAIRLEGEQHILSKAAWSDVHTWEILFFDTWLKGDAAARRALYGATSVEGGVNDQRTYQSAGRTAGR